jgi:iron complex outermembrane receptor protein
MRRRLRDTLPPPRALVAALLVVAAAMQDARAADPPGTAPAAAPAPSSPASQAAADVADREIDIANIVTSAAKGVTTVQEAPAIITIITAEEIRQRGFRNLGQVLSSIPGWIDTQAEGTQITVPMVRGTVQAMLYLRDGVSFFDPVFNAATMSRVVPLETIKRVEVITGPGGVLWGANSFMGIVNVITKDGEDVNGVEVSAGGGHGNGDAGVARAYAMFGKAMWKNRFKLMLHTSFETWEGQIPTARQFIANSVAPQPIGAAVYGYGTVTGDGTRSWLLNLDGKLSLGPVSLYFNVPFGELNYPLAFGAFVLVGDSGGNCGSGRAHCDRSTWNFYDRYGVLEYKDRFIKDKLGINAKAYFIQFNRTLAPRVFPSSATLPGGLGFSVDDINAYRYGGTLDVDFTGPWSWSRILGGAELFHEQAAQSTTEFNEPSAAQLPLVCPQDASGNVLPGCRIPFLYGNERTVAGLFLAAQIRPIKSLTFDGGARYQQGFGQRGYDPQILGSASAVWRFYRDLHLKLNFAQGFRPPVFNNLAANGGSAQFAGNPNLKVERSEAYQAEVNARLLKNVRRVRELQLRLDYAYTLLDDVIVVRQGTYQNSGRRAIHSVEFLGRLYLAGDHFISLAYTFNQIATSDAGEFRSVPRHYFQLGAVFNVVRDILDLNMNLTVLGGWDDPNRYLSGTYTLPGAGGTSQPVFQARLTDFTYDRLPPVALLQLGARVRLWKDHLWLGAQFYNVLNQGYSYPDVFFDQAPLIELRPTPAPAFSFFSSLTFKY